jgi:anti-sigma factor RsiW
VKRCLDEEAIQRLLDDELAPPARRSAEAHLKVCHLCLEAMRKAEREEALLSSLFAPQFSAAVPATRLWGSISAAVYGRGSTARYKG